MTGGGGGRAAILGAGAGVGSEAVPGPIADQRSDSEPVVDRGSGVEGAGASDLMGAVRGGGGGVSAIRGAGGRSGTAGCISAVPIGAGGIVGAGGTTASCEAIDTVGARLTRGCSTYERMNHTTVQNEPRTARIAKANPSTFAPTEARRTSSSSSNVIAARPDDRRWARRPGIGRGPTGGARRRAAGVLRGTAI